MSRVDEDGRQFLELGSGGDLVVAGPPGEPLSPFLMLYYYSRGVFPWLNRSSRLLWWSPDPRAVIFCDRLYVNRSLRKTLRRGHYLVTADTAFDRVVLACRDQPRKAHEHDHESVPKSWIDEDWLDVMSTLHELGHAHSIETWEDGRLVGGLFGICIGQMFFGCSMFHSRPDASKVALARLVDQLKQWRCPVIDCAIYNPYLKSMGATLISRDKFHQLTGSLVQGKRRIGPWTAHFRRSS